MLSARIRSTRASGVSPGVTPTPALLEAERSCMYICVAGSNLGPVARTQYQPAAAHSSSTSAPHGLRLVASVGALVRSEIFNCARSRAGRRRSRAGRPPSSRAPTCSSGAEPRRTGFDQATTSEETISAEPAPAGVGIELDPAVSREPDLDPGMGLVLRHDEVVPEVVPLRRQGSRSRSGLRCRSRAASSPWRC